ncbi:hypothetical protein U9M48_001514 [Paspalum notatum var. saurae]|uniref:Uncharacterized protein n=1 Tax=Paspalum notatum var. saurae TaxID=547442 RepID=A0AAQ3PIA5_PASNO
MPRISPDSGSPIRSSHGECLSIHFPHTTASERKEKKNTTFLPFPLGAERTAPPPGAGLACQDRQAAVSLLAPPRAPFLKEDAVPPTSWRNAEAGKDFATGRMEDNRRFEHTTFLDVRSSQEPHPHHRKAPQRETDRSRAQVDERNSDAITGSPCAPSQDHIPVSILRQHTFWHAPWDSPSSTSSRSHDRRNIREEEGSNEDFGPP